MTTTKITFVHNEDNNDYLQSNMLLIQSGGCITYAEEQCIKQFIYTWEKVFKCEGYDLNEIMSKKDIYEVHMHQSYWNLYFTFYPKWGTPETYTISRK